MKCLELPWVKYTSVWKGQTDILIWDDIPQKIMESICNAFSRPPADCIAIFLIKYYIPFCCCSSVKGTFQVNDFAPQLEKVRNQKMSRLQRGNWRSWDWKKDSSIGWEHSKNPFIAADLPGDRNNRRWIKTREKTKCLNARYSCLHSISYFTNLSGVPTLHLIAFFPSISPSPKYCISNFC